jgi:hypothetical protein
MAFAFINLANEGEIPIRVRLDRIEAVEQRRNATGVRVTTLSGSVLVGRRVQSEVWAAMLEAFALLAENDGA